MKKNRGPLARIGRFLQHRRRLRVIEGMTGPGSVVLEIGAGNNPLRVSTVLLDRYAATSEFHRSGSGEIRLQGDRPFILGDGGTLPFADGSVDVIVCRHVIEHVDDPAGFLDELQRVGRRGYLETPSIFTELVSGGYGVQEKIRESWGEGLRHELAGLEHGSGSKGHKWFVSAIGNRVYFLPKTRDLYPLYLLYGACVKSLGKRFPSDRIPAVSSCAWSEEARLEAVVLSESGVSHASESLGEVYDLQSQLDMLGTLPRSSGDSDPWSHLDSLGILRCPVCRKGSLARKTGGSVECDACGSEYPEFGAARVLLPEAAGWGGGTG